MKVIAFGGQFYEGYCFWRSILMKVIAFGGQFL